MTGTFHIGAHEFEAPAIATGLYLVATPIGNLGDVTIRALQTLAACDVIYCEDTRVTSKLLQRYGLRNAMRNYHDHNEDKSKGAIVAALHEGKTIALVSDAGSPMISDPGYKLVEACVAAGLLVTSVPGASAVVAGLQLSALPSDRFSFMGFLPEKKSQRIKTLASHATHPCTMIYYESPHRVLDALEDLASAYGTRRIAVARELTKLHEEVVRGTASEIQAIFAARPSIKGEFVIIIETDNQSTHPVDDAMIEKAITEALQDMSASKAAALVARTFQLPKEDIYARIVKRKDSEPQDA
jgi:16S rRNA (cytidine1402-2'-O)-methyltransferase